MNRVLREDQKIALENIRASIGSGVKRLVCQAPCGYGKTILSAAIAEGAFRKGNRVAFVVSSLQLIDQTVEKFYQEGIRDIGVIQADHHMSDASKTIQICSIQTIKSRGAYPPAGVVIVDECHSLHAVHKAWLSDPSWQSVPFIGFSATPWSKGLGRYFQTLLIAGTTGEMIDKELLSKFSVFACPKADLGGVKIVAGDYHEGQLSSAMRSGTLTADVVKTWQDRWGRDKTLVFGVDRAHAETLHRRFLESGIRSAYQDALTSSADRKAIERGFADGTYQVVCNIGTLTTGVDWDVRCLVLARPTKSRILYVQIVGRALRTAPGKEKAIILDHSDTTQELGLVTEIAQDHLDDGTAKAKAKAAERAPALARPCPSCASLTPRLARTCQNCGYKLPLASGVVERDGVLVEIVRGQAMRKSAGNRVWSTEDKQDFYAQLLGYALEKKFRPGFAWHKYKAKFGVEPRGMKGISPKPPSYEVRSWITAMWIRARKASRAAAMMEQNRHTDAS